MINKIKDYVQTRIKEIDVYIATEKLAGNAPKELAERAVQAELYGVLECIEALVEMAVKPTVYIVDDDGEDNANGGKREGAE